MHSPTLTPIDLNLLRALAAIREDADRTYDSSADILGNEWERGSVIPDGEHVLSVALVRHLKISGLSRSHYNRLLDLGLLEYRPTDLGGGLIRAHFSISPAGAAMVKDMPSL